MKATIYCYSATGNSLYIAKLLTQAFDADLKPITREKTVCGSEVIGIVFPAFFWGMPLLVENFIKNFTVEAANPYIFAVYTYGGKAPFVAEALAKCLKERGLRLSYHASVKAVENYIPSYRVNDSEKIWEIGRKKTDCVINDLKQLKKKRFHITTPVNTFVHRLYPAYNKNCDTYFSVQPNCIQCGICSRVCPANNIEMADGHPHFMHQCDHCLACLNICPKDAIEWKEKTVGKKRYKNRYITVNELIKFWGK